MKDKQKKLIQVSLISSLLLVSSLQVYASGAPDPYQNSGPNNIAYDLPSKWYVGANLGYSLLGDTVVTSLNQNSNVDSKSIDFGIFGGYKFNNYFALETNFQRLANIKNKSTSSFPFSYSGQVYNFSLDGLLGYPVISKYQYTLSLYGKSGYGINYTNYNYDVNNGYDKRSDHLIHGAYNFGMGIDVDLRCNLSARIGYTYYQAFYPLPGNNSQHNAHVFTVGISYNFV